MRWLLVASTFAVVLVSSSRATADDRPAAQVLFDEARELIKKRDFAKACPKFEESLRLDRGIGTMLWLADCYENNGQPASAWAMFKEAAGVAGLSNDSRTKVAHDRAAALEPKLPRLTIKVTENAPGTEIRRDGTVAGAAEWGTAVPVDPGKHKIEAHAPGRVDWSQSVDIAPTPTTTLVTVPALDRSPEQPPPTEPTKPTPLMETPPPPPEPDHGTGKTQRWLGIGVGAVGVVGLGLGTFFSLHAKSIYDGANANGHCRTADNHCDPTGTSQRHDAITDANIATVAFVAGFVALAGGVVLYLTAPSHR
jgi:hypothetical protein